MLLHGWHYRRPIICHSPIMSRTKRPEQLITRSKPTAANTDARKRVLVMHLPDTHKCTVDSPGHAKLTRYSPLRHLTVQGDNYTHATASLCCSKLCCPSYACGGGARWETGWGVDGGGGGGG